MLLDYVGEDKFLKGVSVYLKNKLYGNGVTEDLWKGISSTTGKLDALPRKNEGLHYVSKASTSST